MMVVVATAAVATVAVAIQGMGRSPMMVVVATVVALRVYPTH